MPREALVECVICHELFTLPIQPDQGMPPLPPHQSETQWDGSVWMCAGEFGAGQWLGYRDAATPPGGAAP